MGLRKGHCYTTVKRAYTRKSKVRSKSYVKAIPPKKIAKFVMGDVEKFSKKGFSHKIKFIVKQDIQIRDNAIESARQIIHRHLEGNFKKDFYMTVDAYPHHILRENKMITGAGADRMQTGMQLSFGSTVGLAVQLNAGASLFTIYVDEKNIPKVRDIIKMANSKLPKEKGIVVEKII